MEENIETKVQPVEMLIVEQQIIDICSEYSSRRQWFHRGYDDSKKAENGRKVYDSRRR